MSHPEFRLLCLFVMMAVAVVPSLSRNIAPEDADLEGDQCGRNEEYSTCGNCDATCDIRNPVCTLQGCKEGCLCKEDYVRNEEGACILPNKCPTGVPTGDEVLLTRIPWNIDEDGEEANEIGDDVNPESPFPEPDEKFGGNGDDEIDETGDGQGPLDAEEDLDEESVGGGGPKPEIPGDGNDDDDDDDDDDGDDDDGDGGSVDETDKKFEPEDILGGISFFDTAVFNLGKVTQYFHDLEAWLKNVLRQTIDEALLLNGTYSNTTEEEVDIDGKKYVVHKSIIRGGDNESSIYVETLSSKRKEGENGMEIKNETKIISTSR